MPIFDRDHADSPEKAYVYILCCADGTLYCGWTNDLAARLDAAPTAERARNTRAAAVRSSSRTAKCSTRRAKPCTARPRSKS